MFVKDNKLTLSAMHRILQNHPNVHAVDLKYSPPDKRNVYCRIIVYGSSLIITADITLTYARIQYYNGDLTVDSLPVAHRVILALLSGT